jgi:UTP:GlnB (protein PII) uridylyltransferase
VLEVRGPDRIGLLYAVAEALEVSSVGVRSARISSLGGFVVDAFYVTDRNVTDDNVTDHNVTDHIADDDAQPLTPQRQSEVSERVLRALMPTGASEPSQDPSS